MNQFYSDQVVIDESSKTCVNCNHSTGLYSNVGRCGDGKCNFWSKEFSYNDCEIESIIGLEWIFCNLRMGKIDGKWGYTIDYSGYKSKNRYGDIHNIGRSGGGIDLIDFVFDSKEDAREDSLIWIKKFLKENLNPKYLYSGCRSKIEEVLFNIQQPELF